MPLYRIILADQLDLESRTILKAKSCMKKLPVCRSASQRPAGSRLGTRKRKVVKPRTFRPCSPARVDGALVMESSSVRVVGIDFDLDETGKEYILYKIGVYIGENSICCRHSQRVPPATSLRHNTFSRRCGNLLIGTPSPVACACAARGCVRADEADNDSGALLRAANQVQAPGPPLCRLPGQDGAELAGHRGPRRARE